MSRNVVGGTCKDKLGDTIVSMAAVEISLKEVLTRETKEN